MEQITKMPLAVHPGSRILFLDDPFAKDEGGTLALILMLCHRTPSLIVDQVKTLPGPASQADINTYKVVRMGASTAH